MCGVQQLLTLVHLVITLDCMHLLMESPRRGWGGSKIERERLSHLKPSHPRQVMSCGTEGSHGGEKQEELSLEAMEAELTKSER